MTEKKTKPAPETKSADERIDLLIELLRTNGISIPEELGK